MSSPLQGKSVFITGAARGIGEAVARLAFSKGAKVAVAGMEPDRLKALASELNGHWAECDVTDQAGVDLAVASTVEAFGGIDYLVANAGVANIGTVNTGPVDALVRTIDVNLNGVVRTASAALPHLRASKGYALMISSAAAFTALPGMAAYCASKAGVEQFANVLRLENAHLGMQVATAHPIWINTDMVRGFKDDMPSFRNARKKMPWPVGIEISVQECATILIKGMEKRKRRIFVPRSIGLMQALRTITLSGLGDRLIKRTAGNGMVEAMEEEVRNLGRCFGSHSVG